MPILKIFIISCWLVLLCSAQSKKVFLPLGRITGEEFHVDGQRFKAYKGIAHVEVPVQVRILSSTAGISFVVKNSIATNSTMEQPVMFIKTIVMSDISSLPVNSGLSSEMTASSKVSVPKRSAAVAFSCPLAQDGSTHTDNCPLNPSVACGVANFSAPAKSSPFGAAVTLLISFPTTSLRSWKATHDTMCFKDVEIELNVADGSAEFLDGQSPTPMLLVDPSSAFSEQDVAKLLSSRSSSARGTMWMPLFTSIGRRSTHPIGVFYNVLKPAFDVEQTQMIGDGFACVLDAPAFPSNLQDPNWRSVCKIPLKGATRGRIALLASESLNVTSWMNGVELTLSHGTGGNTRRIQCEPQFMNAQSCLTYIECGTFSFVDWPSTTLFSLLEVSMEKGNFFPLLFNHATPCTASNVVLVDKLQFSSSALVSQCASTEFSCNGADCIGLDRVCDGAADCWDGSDETSCDEWNELGRQLTIPTCSKVEITSSSSGLGTSASAFRTCFGYVASHSEFGAFATVKLASGTVLCEAFFHNCSDGAIQSSAVEHDSRDIAFSALFSRSDVSAACLDGPACHGNGAANVSQLLLSKIGVRKCVCDCNQGYTGAFCDIPFTISSFSSVVLEVNSPNRLDTSLMYLMNFFYKTRFWVESIAPRSLQGGTVVYSIRLGTERPDLVLNKGLPFLQQHISGISDLSGGTQPIDLPRQCRVVGSEETCYFPVSQNVTREASVAVVQLRSPGATLQSITAVSASGLESVLSWSAPITTKDYSAAFSESFFPAPQVLPPPCSVTSSSGVLPSSTVLVVVKMGITTAPPCDSSRSMSLLLYKRLEVPALQPPTLELEYIKGTKNVSFWGTICCLTIGILCIILTFMFRYFDTQLLHDILTSAAPLIQAAALSTKYKSVTCMSKWCFKTLISCARHDGKPWYKHYTTLFHLFATCAFILVSCGGMFALFYNYDLFEDESNFTVIIEEFADDKCELSPYAPVARRLIAIPATGKCEVPTSVGSSFMSLPRHMRARCVKDGNSHIAELGADEARLDCQNTNAERVKMRKCGTASFSPHITGPLHVACVDNEAAREHLKSHDLWTQRLQLDAAKAVPTKLTGGTVGTTQSTPTTAEIALMKPRSFNSRSATTNVTALFSEVPSEYHERRWLRFDSASNKWIHGVSSSATGDRLLSAALAKQQVIGSGSDVRLPYTVYQTEHFQSSQNGAGSNGTWYLPKTAEEDMSIAAVMNGYRTDNERAGTEAVDAIIFPDMLSSSFNLGLEQEGSILFWLHASRQTKGFAVALTDDWRRSDAPGSPLLQRASAMVERRNNATWAGSDYNLYYGIYVDGFSESIRFISIDPQHEGDNDFVEVTWELRHLGATRVFAESWHHIAVVMSRNQEDPTRIILTLFVDGQSIVSQEGWQRCLPRPITAMSPLHNAKSSSLIKDIQGSNGTVIIGALNAAIYGVEALSHAAGEFEFLSRGTLQMANFFAFNQVNFTVVGFYVLFTAGALLLVMIFGVVQDGWSGYVKEKEEDEEGATRVYTRIMNSDVDTRVTKLSNGKQFNIPSFETAVKLVGLSHDLFSHVLGEIEKLAISDDGAICDLLALLWTRGAKDFTPSTKLAQMYDEWKEKETTELSFEGHFVLPADLWNAFLVFHDGGFKDNRRGGFMEEQDGGGDDVSAMGKAGSRAVRQIRVTKLGGRAAAGRSGASGGSQNASASSSGGTSVSFSAIIEMLLPVMTALQAAGMYVKTFEFPDLYITNFFNVFKYIGLDFFDIPGLPALMGPLITFSIGCLVVLLLLYFTFEGHLDWLRYVAAYVQRRDAVDAPRVFAEGKKMKERQQRIVDEEAPIVEEPPSLIEDWMVPLFRYVLPQKVTNAIDQYFDKSRKSNVVRVKKNDLLPAPVAAKGVDWEIKGTSTEVQVGVANDRNGQTVKLEHVGHRCPLHGTVLREVEQTSVCIKPFECFVIQSGERCCNKVGKMYSCQQPNYDGSPCVFALCEDHFKVTLSQYLIVTILSAKQMVKNLGVSGVVAFIVIAMSVIIYFPVMRICLQFLYCDPAYQCIFERCWNDPDRKFILAVCVVSLVAAYVGILLPIALYRELKSRKKILTRIFHKKHYNKIYLTLDEGAEEELERFNEQDDGPATGWYDTIVHYLTRDRDNGLGTSAQLGSIVTNTRMDTVDFDEWERFLNDDDSPMHHIYKFLEFEWITLPPLMLFYRLGILVPTIFIETGTLAQLASVCAVEMLFGIFIFWSQPYINSWVDTMYRAGSVHNITLLGLSAFHRVLLANGDKEGLTFSMMMTTSIYLSFVILLLGATTIWPLIAYGIKQVRVEMQMARVGLRTNDLASLFLNPLIHDSPTVEAEEVYSEMRKARGDEKEDETAIVAEDTNKETPFGEARMPQSALPEPDKRMSLLKKKSLSAKRSERMKSFVNSRPNAIQVGSPSK